MMIMIMCCSCEKVEGESAAGNYLFKINNRNPRIRCTICSKLTIKTQERRLWVGIYRLGVLLKALSISILGYTTKEIWFFLEAEFSSLEQTIATTRGVL